MGIPNMILTRDFTNSSQAKKWGEYQNAKGHRKYGKFFIETGTTKMGFDINQVDMWFNA